MEQFSPVWGSPVWKESYVHSVLWVYVTTLLWRSFDYSSLYSPSPTRHCYFYAGFLCVSDCMTTIWGSSCLMFHKIHYYFSWLTLEQMHMTYSSYTWAHIALSSCGYLQKLLCVYIFMWRQCHQILYLGFWFHYLVGKSDFRLRYRGSLNTTTISPETYS